MDMRYIYIINILSLYINTFSTLGCLKGQFRLLNGSVKAV